MGTRREKKTDDTNYDKTQDLVYFKIILCSPTLLPPLPTLYESTLVALVLFMHIKCYKNATPAAICIYRTEAIVTSATCTSATAARIIVSGSLLMLLLW